MTDRTRTLVLLFMKTPEFLEALKQDPKVLATILGVTDHTYALARNGLNLIESYANRLSSAGPVKGGRALEIATPRRRVSSGSSRVVTAFPRQGNGVLIAGAVGIVAIAGMLSAASVVATLAITKDNG